jgi:NADH-quinone oxidoreductase subunit N
MNLIQYIYPELFLFIGFLFYFTYNIFSVAQIKLVNLYLNKNVLINLENENFSNIKRINDLFINFKLSLERRTVYQKIKYYISEKNSFFYISILCFITMCLYINQLFWFLDLDGLINNKVYIFGSVYVVDTLSIFLKILITFLSFFFFIISYHVSSFWKFYGFEFGFFVFMVIFSMLILVSANDFFLVFVALEVQTLSIVILCSYQMTQKRSIEAGLKYFIYSSFFSGIFLFAISLIYFIFGIVSFEGIYQLSLGGTLGDNVRDNIYILSIVLISCLIFFKLGIFPYHYWIADVYQGSNLVVTAFLAIISKIGLIGVFIRMYLTMFINFSFFWGNLIFYISLFSMFFGAVAALFQTDIKRFLAYTSISNMGYTLVAFSIGNFDGILYGLIFFIGYLFATLCFFIVLLGVVNKEVSGSDTNFVFKNNLYDFNYFVTLNDFQGLYRNNKLLAFGVLFVILNLLGMPPLTFFFSKYFIFDSFLRYNYFFAIFVFVLTNLISAYYYLRVVKIIFLDRTVTNKLFVFSSRKMAVIFVFFLVLTFILMLHPLFLSYVIDFISLILSKFYI